MGEIEITILNWEKYNPRQDRKGHSWLRFENKVWRCQQFYRFTAEEKWAWVCLLSYASQQGEAKFKVDVEWFCEQAAINEKEFISSIIKLSEHKMITAVTPTGDQVVTGWLPSGSPTKRYDTYDTKNICPVEVQRNDASKTQKTKLRVQPGPKAPVFDFLAIYQIYPKHEGKTDGIKKCERLITTQEQYDKLKIAVQNYAVAKKGVEKRFLKLFSTFMSTWHDWLDPAHGNEAGVVKKERKVVGKLADGTPVYG